MSHTHGAGLVPEEVDGVEAVLVQAVQAVALVPALGEDVEADHASCGGQADKPAEPFNNSCVSTECQAQGTGQTRVLVAGRMQAGRAANTLDRLRALSQ